MNNFLIFFSFKVKIESTVNVQRTKEIIRPEILRPVIIIVHNSTKPCKPFGSVVNQPNASREVERNVLKRDVSYHAIESRLIR